jgi:hypothetical protein
MGLRTLPLLRSKHIISLPFSRREIDRYKVPSKYSTDFLSSALKLWVGSHLKKGSNNFYDPRNAKTVSSCVLLFALLLHARS